MASLTEDDIGKEVTLRARIDHVRPQSEFGGFFCLLACRFLVEEAVVGMIIRVGFRAGCVFGLS